MDVLYEADLRRAPILEVLSAYVERLEQPRPAHLAYTVTLVEGVAAHRDRIDELIASYAPRITAQASAQWGSVSGANSGRNEVHAGVISVQMPFLTGGQREIDIRNAGHLIREAEIRVENTAKAIEAEAQAQAICMQTEDFERAYHAFVAKQKPVFEGN